MRDIHFDRDTAAAVVQPLCGHWGSMDTGWSEDRGAVTCPACLKSLGEARARAAAKPAAP